MRVITEEQREANRIRSRNSYRARRDELEARRLAKRNTIGIAQQAAVPTCRAGCQQCGHRRDCCDNLIAGGLCLCEAKLVGEVV
jgi:hypothetical protein